jgi:Tfp pilus assembly protein PilF
MKGPSIESPQARSLEDGPAAPRARRRRLRYGVIATVLIAAWLGLAFVGWWVYRELFHRGRPRSDAEVAAVRLDQGRGLMDLGHLRAADQALRDASRLSPASYAPRQVRIGILGLERRTADQEAALWDLYQGAGARREVMAEALCLLARGGPVVLAGALRPGEDEGAALDRALKVDPDNEPARAALAYYLRNRGRLDEARALLEPWVQKQGAGPPVGDEYIALLLDEGKLQDAGSIFQDADNRGPSTRRELLRGVWRALRGQHAEAVEAFRAAIQADPRDPEPRHRLAQSLRALGRGAEAESARAWVEAAQELRNLAARIDYAAPDPAALRRAAELCRAMGRDREADAWRRLAP